MSTKEKQRIARETAVRLTGQWDMETLKAEIEERGDSTYFGGEFCYWFAKITGCTESDIRSVLTRAIQDPYRLDEFKGHKFKDGKIQQSAMRMIVQGWESGDTEHVSSAWSHLASHDPAYSWGVLLRRGI